MAERRHPARYFEYFARVTERESPLYSSLSRSIVADDAILALSRHMVDGQPPANVLFGAVHYLILRGADHPLVGFYSTAGGRHPVDGTEFEVFRHFCQQYQSELIPLLVSGRVQTNEVRRAVFLVPAFAWIAARENRPLATAEVGTAAGLLTLWDRYRYDYGDGRVLGDSPLTLSTELRGRVPTLELPPKAWSVGIDIEPIHVDDPDAADWLRALVWPDQTERMHRLEAAIEIAKAHPPALVAGDGIEVLAESVADAPRDATLVVHHSFAFNQVSIEDRTRFERVVADLSSDRDIYLVAVESAGLDDPVELRAGKALAREVPRKTLARVHHHGEWLDWVAE